VTEAPARIVLDVDTGIDDALALAFAVRHPNIQLEAVLTVAGNVGLELTTHNTLRVMDWLDARDVPIAAGADRPLSGVVREASHWHGTDGLGGARLPQSMRSAGKDGIGFLIDRVRNEPGALTLVCTGPLTNLALAVQRQPDIVPAVREVVLMGGAARPPGNVTAVAEFNIYADPEAAAIVFSQRWPVVMVGLDVTNRVLLTRHDRDAVLNDASPAAVLVREVTRRPFDTLGVDAVALHDPLAVEVALDRSLVTTVDTEVAVETHGEHTRGQTVVDLRRSKQANRLPNNTQVGIDVDVERARALFFATLGLQV
jgi:inosine-uridine nucleoside N-ribohydrolase